MAQISSIFDNCASGSRPVRQSVDAADTPALQDLWTAAVLYGITMSGGSIPGSIIFCVRFRYPFFNSIYFAAADATLRTSSLVLV